MVAHEHTTSRRALLGALAVAPIGIAAFQAAPAIAAARDEWSDLRAACALLHPRGAAAVDHARAAGMERDDLITIMTLPRDKRGIVMIFGRESFSCDGRQP
jgi:hypothetical protein